MKKCLSYSMNPIFMRERGERIVELLDGWLKVRKVDAMVYDFSLDEESVSLIIDYSFDNINNDNRVKSLTEEFFDKLSIEYKLEEE